MKLEDMLGGAPVGKPYIRTRDVFQTDNDNGVEGYSDEALALVADTKKTGVPEGVNAVGMAGSAKHGTIAVQLFARVNPETHVIEQAGYRAHGCLAMIASACAAVYWMEGKTVEEAAAISADLLAEALCENCSLRNSMVDLEVASRLRAAKEA